MRQVEVKRGQRSEILQLFKDLFRPEMTTADFNGTVMQHSSNER